MKTLNNLSKDNDSDQILSKRIQRIGISPKSILALYNDYTAFIEEMKNQSQPMLILSQSFYIIKSSLQ